MQSNGIMTVHRDKIDGCKTTLRCFQCHKVDEINVNKQKHKHKVYFQAKGSLPRGFKVMKIIGKESRSKKLNKSLNDAPLFQFYFSGQD